ncbi:MAG: hypothetical protein HKN64_05420, partial [Woeseiaceae bacterium]|nr:hypothetical protein [Woeseiaceae bacterium]
MRRLLILASSTLQFALAATAVAQSQQETANDAVSWGNANAPPVVDAAEAGDPAALVPGYGGTDTPLNDYYNNQRPADLESNAVNAVILAPDPTADYTWQQSNTPILQFS